MGLDLSEAAVDGSIHKAPCGGDGTGKSPVDRGKSGWKWSLQRNPSGTVVLEAAAPGLRLLAHTTSSMPWLAAHALTAP